MPHSKWTKAYIEIMPPKHRLPSGLYEGIAQIRPEANGPPQFWQRFRNNDTSSDGLLLLIFSIRTGHR